MCVGTFTCLDLLLLLQTHLTFTPYGIQICRERYSYGINIIAMQYKYKCHSCDSVDPAYL